MMYLIPLFLVPIYVIWCFYSAYQAREKAAYKLDAILERKDVPEALKFMLVSMYQDSFKQLISAKMLLWAIMGRKTKVRRSKVEQAVSTESSTSFIEDVAALDEESRSEYISTMVSLVMVNIRFAPITYTLVLFVVALMVLFRVVAGGSKKSLLLFIKEKASAAESRFKEEHLAH